MILGYLWEYSDTRYEIDYQNYAKTADECNHICLHFLNICFITAVYTLFALAEYCTIVSNVVFHWLCTHIYKGSTIAILYPDDYVPKMS